jgi:hypothetical protein
MCSTGWEYDDIASFYLDPCAFAVLDLADE